MTTPAPCSGCQRVLAARAGTHPSFIAELRESLVFLHDHQPYDGWCVLMLKDHAEHLHLLSPDRQIRLAEDVAEVARAVAQAFQPRRINYECLGNQLAHIHWHVIPRYQPPIDPDPSNVIWLRSSAELNCGVEPERRERHIHRLQSAGLGRRA